MGGRFLDRFSGLLVLCDERLLVDDVALASELFRRAEPFLPALQGHKLVGFNERWRFYRYGPGQTFTLIAMGPIRG